MFRIRKGFYFLLKENDSSLGWIFLRVRGFLFIVVLTDFTFPMLGEFPWNDDSLPL